MTPTHRQVLRSIVWLGLAGICGIVLTLAGSYLYLNPQIPAAESYLDFRPEAPMRVFTADGALMAEYGERRFVPVRFEAVPEDFVNALLDTEDKRFYDHAGIDYISLANDILQVLLNPSVRTGASTITMQLAKNVSFSLEQTFVRKFKEMLLAIKIEQELTKRQILELYINVMFYGKRAYGAQAAALTYYGRPLSELRLAQLAMLAGIIKRPDAGNPVNGPEWALRRRNLVLARMLAQGSIERAAYEEARAAPITARVHRREPEVSAPYAAEWARNELVARYGTKVYKSGYEVYSTIEAGPQKSATRALRDGLSAYDRRHGYRGPEARIGDVGDLPPLTAHAPDPAYSVAGVLPEGPRAEQVGLAHLLADVPTVADLLPAVVIRVDERAFHAVTAAGARAMVGWNGMKWARPYIHVDWPGERPRSAAEIVAPGDIIRLQKQADGDWRLAQVPEIRGALVALRPSNGAVAALVGGYDFWSNQFDHALRAARQPGSGFKPFVYSAALAHGFTPASIFLDAPLVFPGALRRYTPRNTTDEYNGPTRLREALYRSINLVSVRVLLRVGVDRVLAHARRFGFGTAGFPNDVQLALGGGTMAVTPLEMARAYTVIANGGYLVEPHIVQRVTTRDGSLVFDPAHPEVAPGPPPLRSGRSGNHGCGKARTGDASCRATASSAKTLVEDTSDDSASTRRVVGGGRPQVVPAPRVVDERNIFILHSMLRDVIECGTGRRALALGRTDIAGKTGTTNEGVDTWFNGYNGDVAASVWLGFSDHRPAGAHEYGSTTPLSVWMDFMEEVVAGTPARGRTLPHGVVRVRVDPESGRPVAPGHHPAIFEYFLEEATPRTGGKDLDASSDAVTIERIFSDDPSAKSPTRRIPGGCGETRLPGT